jgi:hypothetical protein
MNCVHDLCKFLLQPALLRTILGHFLHYFKIWKYLSLGEGVSPLALISIQTGWESRGKFCDQGDGTYADVETVITKGMQISFKSCISTYILTDSPDLRNWIIKEISSLEGINQIYNMEESTVKAQVQSTHKEYDKKETTTMRPRTTDAIETEFFNMDSVTEFD